MPDGQSLPQVLQIRALSVSASPSVSLSVCLSVCLSVRLFVHGVDGNRIISTRAKSLRAHKYLILTLAGSFLG